MNNNIVAGIVMGLIIGLVIGWGVSNSSKVKTSTDVVNQNIFSPKATDFRLAMNKLWEDHIAWTRNYLISAAYDNGDDQAVTARLLKNQEDIGNAVKSYYGNDAGDKLTSLLKEHITLAVDLVKAAKANDTETMNTVNTKWYDNAYQIADFLAGANPNWSQNELRMMMKDHLDLTKQEAVDILEKKYEAGVADYDKVHDGILKMSDAIAGGIIKQYPEKFK